MEGERRVSLLTKEATDITPQNKGAFPWTGVDAKTFDAEWNMKPVKVKGVFDHKKEIQVDKAYRGEKGVEVITPFYTHLDKDGEPCAILVNRGWVPYDIRNNRLHFMNNNMGSIEGVLYRGDKETKYSFGNAPVNAYYKTVKPSDLAIMATLPNEEEASQVMLHMVDFDPEVRQVLPTIPTTDELLEFPISPERHNAYEMMWRGLSFAGVIANTAMWLYL